MWGNTPLILAAQYNAPALVQALLDSGANVTITNESSATALHFACLEGMDDAILAGLLSRGAPVDPAPARMYNSKTDCHTRMTPLLAAAANGHLNAVRRLLEAGASIDRSILPALSFTTDTPDAIACVTGCFRLSSP
jgi:uncharacterized protein